ncbi:MAG: LemA family protein [Chitinophagales bacterium]|nr:LemA family protein [Chitinophagales bacterium]
MIIIAAILVFLLLLVIIIYNKLISRKNAVDNAFFSMDVMLKKRYDLIPQLVDTVKGYMQHEKELLTNLTAMRQKSMELKLSANDKVSLDNQINDALQQVFIRFENYPDLKASENFLKLQGAINETEEQLAAARRFYNAAVNDYHNAIETFPSSMIASGMNMKHKIYFNIPETDKAVPVITINQ